MGPRWPAPSSSVECGGSRPEAGREGWSLSQDAKYNTLSRCIGYTTLSRCTLRALYRCTLKIGSTLPPRLTGRTSSRNFSLSMSQPSNSTFRLMACLIKTSSTLFNFLASMMRVNVRMYSCSSAVLFEPMATGSGDNAASTADEDAAPAAFAVASAIASQLSLRFCNSSCQA